MNRQLFKEKIKKITEQKNNARCEYCPHYTDRNLIVCQAYSLKQNPHFKHYCATCDQLIFDGSKKFKKHRLIHREL